MNNKQLLHIVTYALVIVGALNWGLLALLNINLVNMILGAYPTVEKLVYMLVGLSALYDIFIHKNICKLCEKMMK
ncbi:hypothetical protein A3C23_01230 [Candidatus Roizmanbacteria bacterium RIFCSPHIGHO2_02_FULL_37_13b]|uniref:DUF378 domain-containing protein n=1 Tax=Candidatus Roizmanbacteria bacterium RIFCSPLOWO2_02_FULL_36_11 TaxID=1802071 RepID=A0A1F7JHF8_9BACT|nr:MAG: hypothetical protein A3C23_01230 [Candidatus Roizmanbacteria bacterium RIFCSPHIGHO2_02_FULL_37_13b]OGK55038.1 MAG: hypothetical protein A3H78_01005 [Candidatus Roizmanbacteria bacterium RIFCSPLOWO2_02_FULL_36_11]